MGEYERFEPEGTGPITPQQALEGITRIRDSIIGTQTINWSEHIYPLVSLLNRAGYEGLPYPEARANVGIVLDRLQAAEREAATLREALADLVRLKDGPRDDAYRAEKDAAWDRARAALAGAGRSTEGEG